MQTVEYNKEVEISPGKWLSISASDTVHKNDAIGGSSADESSRMSFKWKEIGATWSGKDIPISLREYEGSIYFIGYNRENQEKDRLHFYRFNERKGKFREIEPQDYPKSIAIQNMWLRPATRNMKINDTMIDTWEVLRELDVQNPYFTSSFTAYIWYQTVTGKDLYEMPYEIPVEFLLRYMAEHSPVALPTIIKN